MVRKKSSPSVMVQIPYMLDDFYATEQFTDPSKITREFYDKERGIVLHNVATMHEIHDSLKGGSAGDALYFLYQFSLLSDGYKKEHSVVKAVSAKYRRFVGTPEVPVEPNEIDVPFDQYYRSFIAHSLNPPYEIDIPFDEYCTLGRREMLTLTLTLTPYEVAKVEASRAV